MESVELGVRERRRGGTRVEAVADEDMICIVNVLREMDS